MKSADEWFEAGMRRLQGIFWQDHPTTTEEAQQEALELFQRALALQPTHLGALRQSGLLLAGFGRHEEAVDCFVTVAGLSTADADLHFEVAQSLLHLGQVAGALDAFNEVLRLRPGDQRAHAERAATLMTLGRDELALEAWDLLLNGPGPHSPEAWLSRARTLAKLGRAEAFAAFGVAIEKAGPFGTLPQLFPEDLRQHEVARRAFHAHLEARAAEPFVWRRAGHTWAAAGGFDEAIAAWDRLVALQPDDFAFFEQARALERADRLDAALAACRRSMELGGTRLGQAMVMDRLRDRGALGPWKVMGRDTFAREDFMVGEFPTKAAAEARVRELEASTATTQDESLQDSFWLVPPS